MEVVITDFAWKEIQSIHRYYKKRVSKNIADKLVNKILDAIDKLKFSPMSGTKESLLRQLHLSHRYIVTGNYKIIFRSDDKFVYVTDVFDTRQNPKKIYRRNKIS